MQGLKLALVKGDLLQGHEETSWNASEESLSCIVSQMEVAAALCYCLGLLQ